MLLKVLQCRQWGAVRRGERGRLPLCRRGMVEQVNLRTKKGPAINAHPPAALLNKEKKNDLKRHLNPPTGQDIIDRIPECKTQMDLVNLCSSLSTTPVDSNTLPALKALLKASQETFSIKYTITSLLLNFLTSHQRSLSQEPTFSTTGGIFFTKMLKNLLHYGDFQMATHLLHLLLRNAIKVNMDFYEAYLRYCIKLDLYDEAILLHLKLKEKNPEMLLVSTSLVHILAEMYARMGRLEEVKSVWDQVKVKDNQSWNAMVMAYIKGNCVQIAEELMRERKSDGVITNATWNLLIKTKFVERKYKEALKLFREMERSGVKADVSCWNIVIKSLFKNNQIQLGKEYFELMRASGVKQTAMTWNLLFECFFEHEVYYLIDNLIEEMKVNKIPTNEFTWTILIQEYLNHQLVDKAIHCFELSKAFGVVPDLVFWNMFLKGLLKNNEFEKALHYFELMGRSGIKPAVSTWTVLIKAYLNTNQIEKALEFFSKMQSQGLTTDSNLWNSLLGYLFDTGKQDLAFKYIQIMKDEGYVLDGSNWHVIIKGYIKIDTEKAMQLFEALPTHGIVIDVDTWNMVIEELVKLEKWEMASNYMQKMKQNGLKPHPETQDTISLKLNNT